MFDIDLHTLVSLMALGMALAFVTVDASSRVSRALSAALAFTGIAIFLNVSLVDLSEQPPAWSGWLAIPESLALIAMLEWLYRVRQTIPAEPGMNTRFGDRVLRVGQASAALYSFFAILAPEYRLLYFSRAGVSPEAFESWQFWLFAAPIELAALAGLVALLMLLNRKPDRIERVRVIAMSLAVPFFLAGFILPADIAAVSCVLGEIILLIGSVRYYMEQGRRGEFMARFLSPEVARIVAEKGLTDAMRENQIEITVVCADLRGFTPFASRSASSEVLGVLREYYDAVGEVVAEAGATIKDYAGDGILILVGAPLPAVDHAERGLNLAEKIRDTCLELSRGWARVGVELGIGVGVASGRVTVGVIGSAALEYTAVGSAVNLASRLCEQATHGEVLVDDRTRQLAPQNSMAQRPPLTIKGFPEPVQLHVMTSGA